MCLKRVPTFYTNLAINEMDAGEWMKKSPLALAAIGESKTSGDRYYTPFDLIAAAGKVLVSLLSR